MCTVKAPRCVFLAVASAFRNLTHQIAFVPAIYQVPTADSSGTYTLVCNLTMGLINPSLRLCERVGIWSRLGIWQSMHDVWLLVCVDVCLLVDVFFETALRSCSSSFFGISLKTFVICLWVSAYSRVPALVSMLASVGKWVSIPSRP